MNIKYSYSSDIDIDTPKGFYAAGIHAGIKKKSRPDAAMLFSDHFLNVSGVFTQNKFRSRVIDYCIKNISNPVKALLVFSGNAIACTGKAETETINKVSEKAAEIFNCSNKNILQAYTGVIGRPFPVDTVLPKLAELKNKAQAKDKKESFFSRAIMTTDTVEKKISAVFTTENGQITISGCTKGSGMVYPNMATILTFITTDAELQLKYQNNILKKIADKTFNMISVDGDTSTNDSFFLLSKQKNGTQIKSKKDKKLFEEALYQVSLYLAQSIIKDGEGATKFITINVKNAKTLIAAEKICRAVANSTLVKTAVFGNDPNWGRIISAVGNSGASFKPENVELLINGCLLFKDMGHVPGNTEKLNELMKQKEINIELNLHNGKHKSSFWTCDLSYEYVKINAEYTT